MPKIQVDVLDETDCRCNIGDIQISSASAGERVGALGCENPPKTSNCLTTFMIAAVGSVGLSKYKGG